MRNLPNKSKRDQDKANTQEGLEDVVPSDVASVKGGPGGRTRTPELRTSDMVSPLALRSIPFTAADRASQSFQHSRMVSGTVLDIVAQLRKAIEAADLWVLHEIDPQMLLARGGFGIEAARQILLFHPAIMARLLAADSSALLEAPLKFALTHAGDGKVMIRWSDPIATFARYGNEELAQLGHDLTETCDRIVAGLLDS